ncbi:MAG: amidase, partial [Clostridiaceae bacterium]|nr:amidase [Clostridiaceae bacterium]
MNRFELMETTIKDVHDAMREGSLTCRALVEAYLARIDAYDQKGPKLNAIITVNPHALDEADRLDRAFHETGGFTGPLHGIPVLLKDNVNTNDMPTTAGSISLEGYYPPKDGFIT